MKDRIRFWVYGLSFVLCLNLIAGILSTRAGKDPLAEVLTVLISGGVILFLALYNYQPLRTERDRERILLKRVQDSWVESLTELQRFAPGASLIDLEYRQNGTEGDAGTLRVARVFEEARRSLVVLGAEGSGKTASVLMLTRHLVSRALRHPEEPVPVILSLSSWNDQTYKNFESWLVDELKLKYGLAETVALTWLIGRRLLLILDGLDEVNDRPGCMLALDAFLEDFKPPGIVVSSRSETRPDIEKSLPQLTNIEILDLSPEQIRNYSAYSVKVFAHGEDSDLARLARSPLNLMLILVTGNKNLNTRITREDLLKAFIDKQLGLAVRIKLPEKPEKIRRRLRWLAQAMAKHSQAVFYIEGLQPSWFDEKPLISIRLPASVAERARKLLQCMACEIERQGHGKLDVQGLKPARAPKKALLPIPFPLPEAIAGFLSKLLTFYTQEFQRSWFEKPLMPISVAERLRLKLLNSAEETEKRRLGIFVFQRFRPNAIPVSLRLPRGTARLIARKLDSYIERFQRPSLPQKPSISVRMPAPLARVLMRLHLLPTVRFQVLGDLEDEWIVGDTYQLAYAFLSRFLATLTVMALGYLTIKTTNRGLAYLLGVTESEKVSFGLDFVSENPLDWLFITIVFGGLGMALLDYWRFQRSENLNLVMRVRATLTERGDFRNLIANIVSLWPIFFFGAMVMHYAWQKLFPASSFFQFNYHTALSGATIYAIAFGLVVWFRGVGRSPRSDIRTAEKVTFTWSSFLRGAGLGAVGGAFLGLLPTILVAEKYGWTSGKDGWVSAIKFWPISALIGLIVGGVTNGFGKVSVIEKSYPNQGVRLSLRNTILIWLVVGGASSLVIWVYAILATGDRWVTLHDASVTLQDAVLWGSVVGMLVGFGYGGLDVVYHMALRLLLFFPNRVAPIIKVRHFLDNVTYLGFLRRVGGGYMFLHGSLRKQFEESDDPVTSGQPPTPTQS